MHTTVFIECIVSEILLKNQKLITLIIHGTKESLCIRIYILLNISPYVGHIRLVMDKNYLGIYTNNIIQESDPDF